MRTYTIVTSKGRKVRADYQGGPYIELTFTSLAYKPTEVINVFDYEKGRAYPPFDRWDELDNDTAKSAIRTEVFDWIRSNEDEGWLDWYEDYIRNAR